MAFERGTAQSNDQGNSSDIQYRVDHAVRGGTVDH